MTRQQLSLLFEENECEVGYETFSTPLMKTVKEPISLLPLSDYDIISVSLSGGKDSMACILYLLEQGVDPSKLEFVHQCVDGGETDMPFMDWAVTESYCQAVGDYFNVPVQFQWRVGGIRGEMLRKESLTGDVFYINENGETVRLETKRGKLSTRLRFPAIAADLRTRWCSGVVKIDVYRRVLNNHPKYQNKKVLVITGERREESPNRAKYLESEIHACNSPKKMVHAWRPVIDWKEEQIWDIMKRWNIQPHPAYMLGWSRTSCFGCIFSSPSHWAMMREIAPERFEKIVEMERNIQHTMHKGMTLIEKANKGSIDKFITGDELEYWKKIALNNNFTKEDLYIQNWAMPKGAFGGYEGGPV